MLRHSFVALTATLVLIAGPSAQAGAIGEFFACFSRDFHRNNAWPQPFVQPDREAVVAPMRIMTANGWRRQNTLGDDHFEEGKTQLNLAGEAKVRWILTQTPIQYRTVFVERGFTTDETAARVNAVQQVAQRMSPAGEVAQVFISYHHYEGIPGEDVQRVHEKYDQTRPDPRLPAKQGDGNGKAGGS